jgi:hypothetical protein
MDRATLAGLVLDGGDDEVGLEPADAAALGGANEVCAA